MKSSSNREFSRFSRFSRRTILLSLTFLLIVIGLYLYVRKRKVIAKTPFKNVWSDEYKEKALYMLKKSRDILNSLGIPIIAMYGTLLGIKRHGGFIPWDDDLDVAAPLESLPVILENKSLFAKHGIGVVPFDLSHTFIKFYSLSEPLIEGKKWSWPFIDVFGYRIVRGKEGRGGRGGRGDTLLIKNETIFFHDEFPITDFFPLKREFFHNVLINVPASPERVLKKLYGKNWESECISSSFNHRKERSFNRTYRAPCKELVSVGEELFDNVWVINLDKRPDRWNRTRERLARVGITPRRWRATDAAEDWVKGKYEALPSPKRSIGEVACYLSHKSLWKYIVRESVKCALIFEDDILFKKGVGKEEIMREVKESVGFNILYLGHCYSSIWSKDTRVGTAQCLHAYVLSFDGAKKLLESEEDFLYPVDVLTEKVCKSELCFISGGEYSQRNGGKFGRGIVFQDEDSGSNLRGKGVF